jgi:hypothetical protein
VVDNKWYKHPVIVSATIINAFCLLLALIWANNPHELSRLLVEDGIVEWMQFLAFSLTSGLLGYVAIDRFKSEGFNLGVLVLAGLSGLVALAALEEVSWFQRVLQIQSPEWFLQNNRQAETNLHNLGFGEESLHKAVLLKIIVISGLIHNLFLPLLARKRPAIRDFVERFGLYLPPLAASVPYLVLVILSHLWSTIHARASWARPSARCTIWPPCSAPISSASPITRSRCSKASTRAACRCCSRC